MPKPVIHPNWAQPPAGPTDGFSLEVTARDVDSLRKVAGAIPPQTPIAVTWLANEELDGRVAAAVAIRALGFEPMPHFSVRRLRSEAGLTAYLERVVSEAGVRRCFIVAGDPAQSAGPFNDSTQLIETGAFERAGIEALGIGGHPEGHPHMTQDMAWQVLESKCRIIEERGMAPLIVTQFGFDPATVLRWLQELRERGLDAPVRIGVAGPASIATLIRYATRCGVAASSAVLSKYCISFGKLLGQAGPDKLVEELASGLGPGHGPVRLHFYPFGGLERTMEWITGYSRTHPSMPRQRA